MQHKGKNCLLSLEIALIHSTEIALRAHTLETLKKNQKRKGKGHWRGFVGGRLDELELADERHRLRLHRCNETRAKPQYPQIKRSEKQSRAKPSEGGSGRSSRGSGYLRRWGPWRLGQLRKPWPEVRDLAGGLGERRVVADGVGMESDSQ